MQSDEQYPVCGSEYAFTPGGRNPAVRNKAADLFAAVVWPNQFSAAACFVRNGPDALDIGAGRCVIRSTFPLSSN